MWFILWAYLILKHKKTRYLKYKECDSLIKTEERAPGLHSLWESLV